MTATVAEPDEQHRELDEQHRLTVGQGLAALSMILR